MAPKVAMRRPGAAPGRGGVRAKARPKAKAGVVPMRRSVPAPGGRRRVRGGDARGWKDGVVMQLSEVPSDEMTPGLHLVLMDASYYRSKCNVSGKVKSIEAARPIGTCFWCWPEPPTRTCWRWALRSPTKRSKCIFASEAAEKTKWGTSWFTLRKGVWCRTWLWRRSGSWTWNRWRDREATTSLHSWENGRKGPMHPRRRTRRKWTHPALQRGAVEKRRRSPRRRRQKRWRKGRKRTM